MQIHYHEIVTEDVDAVCAAYAATNSIQFGRPDAATDAAVRVSRQDQVYVISRNLEVTQPRATPLESVSFAVAARPLGRPTIAFSAAAGCCQARRPATDATK